MSTLTLSSMATEDLDAAQFGLKNKVIIYKGDIFFTIFISELRNKKGTRKWILKGLIDLGESVCG